MIRNGLAKTVFMFKRLEPRLNAHFTLWRIRGGLLREVTFIFKKMNMVYLRQIGGDLPSAMRIGGILRQEEHTYSTNLQNASAPRFLRLLSNWTRARGCLSAYEWTHSSETAALALIHDDFRYAAFLLTNLCHLAHSNAQNRRTR